MASTAVELLRRRFGGHDTINDYVQNGLVFHLDGINRGGISGKWTEIINNIDFTLDNCIENSNNIQFSKTGHSTAYTTSSIGDFQSNVCTIEAACNINNYKNVGLFTTPTNGGICLCIATAGNIGFAATGRNLNRYNFSSNGVSLLSLNDNLALHNGNSLTRNSITTVFVNSTRPTIGSFSGNYTDLWWFDGSIYSIRIYNRLLTRDEMLHNQQVDNKRFHLGITI